jgi:PTS system nitrogen regulatory IIA component
VNPLQPLLRDDHIVLDADVHDRDELFRLASDLLASHHGLHGKDVFRALVEREALGSTAMGHGIAIPHARIAGLREAAVAYIRTRQPLAFGAPEGRPVSQFLFLLVPKEANERHLQLMAAAAGLLSDPRVRGELRSCRECGDVRRVLSESD